MCGICGYVGMHQPDLLERMCRLMAHRGPDDQGTWHDSAGEAGLGHRRLSIIDLSPAGHQPMSNEDDSVWITYNGEIYNFPELREQLVARGHRFRSQTDTEVLIHQYEEDGPDFVQRLNGIFALAIWDTRTRQLLLARDHAGVKPLYYWTHGRTLVFASEIKALLQHAEIPNRLNRAAVAEYLTFLWVPGDHTMLEGISKLEPGHLLIWKDGRIQTRPWFELNYEPDVTVPADEWTERVHDTFMRTTRRQMVSDVPLGAFLSGGADSSSIVACMRHAFPDRHIKCYTVQFPEGAMVRDQFVEDYPYAQRVADSLNVELHAVTIEPRVVELLPRMIWHLDEPDADPAVFPSYLIAKLAREDGTTVLLSGTGGDEVLFGYRSFIAYRHYERWSRIPNWLTAPALAVATRVTAAVQGAQGALPRRLRKLHRGLTRSGLERHMAMADWSSRETRSALLSPEFPADAPALNGVPACMRRYDAAFRGSGVLNHRAHLLIQTFLGAHNFLYTDKSSMASSIEVRVPFMDVEFMRLCAQIPESIKLRGNVTKYPLKQAMQRYLPRDVLHRSKTGFGAPLRKWIAEDLDEVISASLGVRTIRARGLFDAVEVARIFAENRANRADHAYLIYALLTLEIWQQTFVDRRGEMVSL
jgi:asparagine synthase (glutamine-hydrolysing)